MQYKFIIKGNESDLKGNPRPKLKMTKNQQWTPLARRYVEWKKHIVSSFLAELKNKDVAEFRYRYGCFIANGKPIIENDIKMRMDIKIWWKSRQHGDPENIFGSIADALFKQDKNLAGSFDFDEAIDDVGKVEVSILLS